MTHAVNAVSEAKITSQSTFHSLLSNAEGVTRSKRRSDSLRASTRCAIYLVLCLLSGCAGIHDAARVQHGFNVTNLGDSLIYDVSIQYGSIHYRDCLRGCAKSAGSFYGVYMPIQDEMFVKWKTSDKVEHQAKVPVLTRVLDSSRLDALFLQFNGDRLTVLQGLHYSNPGLVGLEKVALYP